MPSKYLIEYLSNQNINIEQLFTDKDSMGNIDQELDNLALREKEGTKEVKEERKEAEDSLDFSFPDIPNVDETL